jgi:pimeloyl-ACP methyl ester carboxylesterase
VSTTLPAIVRGAGEDVVLVHGSLGDYRQWTPIVERLQPHFRAVAVSRRYHWPGDPPASDAVYSYQSHCDDLLEYLHRIARPVHLVGHSYGAGIALLAAVREPALVGTLTLIEVALASLLPPADSKGDLEVASRSSMIATVQSLARAGADEKAARVLIDWLQGSRDGFAGLPEAAQHGLLENAKTVGPTFASPAPTVTRSQLAGLDIPTLVLHGEHTRPYFALISETLASSIPGAVGAQIPQACHMTIVERPAETAALLLNFLHAHRMTHGVVV